MNEKLKKAISKLTFSLEQFSIYPLSWDIRESKEVPTMGTDYKQLLYNGDFMDKLSIGEVVGVLLHEIFHCVFLHPSQVDRGFSKGKNPFVWNLALEQVVNSEVLTVLANQTEFSLPGEPVDPVEIVTGKAQKDGYVYSPDFKDMDEITVYEELMKHYKPEHELNIKIYLAGSDSEKSKGVLTNDVFETKQTAQDTQEAIEKAIATLTKMAKAKGSLPGNLERLLKKLTQSRIPWKRILHSFVSQITQGYDEYSFTRPDTRHPLANEMIIPATQGRVVDDGVIVVDTSGSISEKQLAEFASGIAGALKELGKLTVVTTDTKVYEKVRISSVKELLSKIKFKGGGGTDFDEVFTQIKECNFMVFFTDGDANYPKKPPKYPVLWVLTKDGQQPPWGKVVHILEE